MASDAEIRAATTSQGLRIKRKNLFAALLSGAALAGLSVALVPVDAAGLATGLAVGLIYANVFEYCLHRYVLHCGRGVFCQQHLVHHETWQSPEAARYVNFSSNPLGVVALFLANALPFLAVEWVFQAGWPAGAFAGFTVYYMAFEEIHWRSHMGGWLPGWARPAARHHLLHHVQEDGRFNVFLPATDWVVERLGAFTGKARERHQPEAKSPPGPAGAARRTGS